MTYRVCKRLLIVIARTAPDAVRLFDELSDAPGPIGEVFVRDMDGLPVNVEMLRADLLVDRCQIQGEAPPVADRAGPNAKW